MGPLRPSVAYTCIDCSIYNCYYADVPFGCALFPKFLGAYC